MFMFTHLTMPNLLLLTIFVIMELPTLFSIRFDEYYDSDGLPNEGLEDYPCLQIGVKCKLSQECCGVACCVLPAWSQSPVCLVPGYKKDLRLVQVFGKDTLDMDDDLYLRQQFNKTFESLLMNFTSIFTQDIGETSANAVSAGDQDSKMNYETSFYNVSSSEISNETETKDFTLINELNINNIPEDGFQDSLRNISSDSQKDKNGMFGQNLFETNKSDLTTSLEILSKNILNHHSFLLLNSSLQNAKIINLADVYENFKSGDQFKTIFEELQENLKSFSEHERRLGFNFTAVENFSLAPTTFATTKSPSTIPSKWDIVRNFIRSGNNVENFKTAQEKDDAKDTENEDNLGLEEIMKEIFKDSDEIINSENLKDNEGIVEVFDFKIPYQGQNNDGSQVNNNSLDNAFNTLTNTINSLKPNYDPIKGLAENYPATSTNTTTVTIENTTKKTHLWSKIYLWPGNGNKNSPITTSTPTFTTENTTNRITNQTNKTHLWLKIYLWPVAGNVSHRITTNIKNILHWKRKTNSSDKTNERKQILLNEHFLLTLNSKNSSKKGFLKDILSESNTEKIFSDYSIGSSSMESASSYAEDLYNNSIVFVMHKKNSSSSGNNSTWGSFFNFFHIFSIPGVIHCPKNKNPCINPLTGECSLTDEETIANETTETTSQEPVHKIVRLPKSLMPEELEKRLENDTDVWLLEDANEINDKSIEEQNGTNSTFLFFFK